MSTVIFRAYPQFNTPDLQRFARLRANVGERAAEAFVRWDRYDQLAWALCDRRAVPLKEVLESGEFHSRMRKRLRQPVVADLCCGHGLTGALFAMEDCVEQVLLLDRKRPLSVSRVIDAVRELDPKAAAKIRWIDADVEDAAAHLPVGCSVLGIHACGGATDRILDAALEVRAKTVAVMPCCYSRTNTAAPQALREHLGAEMTSDVHRTYRLEAAGYLVDWAFIPEPITPMNRIVLGTRKEAPTA